MSACRLCSAELGSAILVLEGMPGAAQHLPTEDQLHSDVAQTLGIQQCTGCGLAQVDCEPVTYFREVIRAIAFSEEMRVFRKTQLESFAARFGLAGKPVLEIGSGRGEYLDLLNQAGMKSWGTEYGKASAEAAAQLGHKVQQVFPDSAGLMLDGAPFAAVFSFNFMEHWPNPRAVLQCVANNLEYSAVGLIEVPNFDMLIEKQMATEFVADHLSYFTSTTLRTALELSGFEVLELQEVWYRYILSAVVRKRSPIAAEPFKKALEAQRTRVDNFINRAGYNGVAIWGAGHQALATMGLLGLGKRIQYVVDSAPFKQGRFTPATHIPIVPPEMLDTKPVDSILIMAAGFSDEVANIIKTRWGDRFRLAILREDHLEEL